MAAATWLVQAGVPAVLGLAASGNRVLAHLVAQP